MAYQSLILLDKSLCKVYYIDDRIKNRYAILFLCDLGYFCIIIWHLYTYILELFQVITRSCS